MAARHAMLMFGEVRVPVSLDGVMKERNGKVSFKTLHKGKDHLAPIKQHKFCVECGEEVTKENQTSGFEVTKGKFVPVSEEEKASVETSSESSLVIHKWIDPLDPFWFDKSYWLSPREMFESNYAIFAKAVEKTGLWGFGSSKVWGEHPCVVRSESGVLILTMLHSQPEFNLAGRPAPPETDNTTYVEATAKEIMAWASPLDESDLLVTEDVLMKSLIQSKLDGSEFVAPPVVEAPEPTVDFMAALKATQKMRPAKTRARKVAA